MLVTLAPSAHRPAEASEQDSAIGQAMSVGQDRAMLSAINCRLKRSGEPTPTPFNPKQLFAPLKDCSIQSL